MEAKDLQIAAGQSQTIQAAGSGFRFESGASTTADTYLRVKPESGNEMVVKPGQQFRLAQESGSWTLNANDATAALTGRVLIFGASENFEDSNTSNVVVLDGTFTNSVNVNNTVAERVPVTLDTTQTQPVSIANTVTVQGTVNIAGATVEYTNSFADASVAAVTAQVIFTPAQNLNGAFVEFAQLEIAVQVGTNATFSGALIAKAGPPASVADGDVLLAACMSMTSTATAGATEQVILPVRIKVAAGKGLYWNQSAGAQLAIKTVLYTLL
ncbi:MAG: hypothetical protein WA191_14505 [Telluria sp.]